MGTFAYSPGNTSTCKGAMGSYILVTPLCPTTEGSKGPPLPSMGSNVPILSPWWWDKHMLRRLKVKGRDSVVTTSREHMLATGITTCQWETMLLVTHPPQKTEEVPLRVYFSNHHTVHVSEDLRTRHQESNFSKEFHKAVAGLLSNRGPIRVEGERKATPCPASWGDCLREANCRASSSQCMLSPLSTVQFLVCWVGSCKMELCSHLLGCV